MKAKAKAKHKRAKKPETISNILQARQKRLKKLGINNELEALEYREDNPYIPTTKPVVYDGGSD